MKELSIQEKAKRYDEAIKKAKSKIKNDKDHVLYEDDVIEMFPELAESGDERIKKEMIEILRKEAQDYPSSVIAEKSNSWIAWLEKQGEQRPAWSEDDESRMDYLCHFLEEYGNQYYRHLTLQGTISWLKSLRPQSQWKPSDMQMHYLSWIANIKLGDSVVEQEVSKHLNELLEDLKKLKGE